MLKSLHYSILVVIVLLTSYTNYAQETIYGTGPARYTTLGSPVESGDSIYFNITTHTSPDHRKSEHKDYASFFMAFDQNGILGYSILHPDTSEVASDSVYFNKMGESIDPNIAFFSYHDAGSYFTNPPKARTFGVYDISKREIIRQVPLDTAGKLGPHIVTTFAQNNSHLIVGGGVVVDPFSSSFFQKFYSIYDKDYNLLQTRVDSNTGGGAYHRIEFIDGRFFIIHYNSATIHFEVLNSDLSTDTVLPRPSSYPWPSAPHIRYDIRTVPNANGPGFYMLSFYRTGHYAVAKFNEDYSVARIDSFPIKDNAYGHAYPWKNAFDWNSPDTIYGIAGFLGTNGNPWYGADSAGRTEPFRVVQFDTTGTMHWSRLIGRDGAVYFPYQVVATNDGGVLVFSWLYDSQYSTQIHSRLSVIKIGADGSVLHQNEYKTPTSSELVLYPNPVKDELYVQLPEELAYPGDYRIFSIGGGTQLGGHFTPGQPLPVEQLVPGTYILHLHLDNGLVQAGRFVKM